MQTWLRTTQPPAMPGICWHRYRRAGVRAAAPRAPTSKSPMVVGRYAATTSPLRYGLFAQQRSSDRQLGRAGVGRHVAVAKRACVRLDGSMIADGRATYRSAPTRASLRSGRERPPDVELRGTHVQHRRVRTDRNSFTARSVVAAIVPNRSARVTSDEPPRHRDGHCQRLKLWSECRACQCSGL